MSLTLSSASYPSSAPETPRLSRKCPKCIYKYLPQIHPSNDPVKCPQNVLPAKSFRRPPKLFSKCQYLFPKKGQSITQIVPLDDPIQNCPSRSDQIRSVAQSCSTLCDPMNRSTPGLPVHHQLPHVHHVSDAIQPSHPLSSPSPFAPNPSKHQSLFQ